MADRDRRLRQFGELPPELVGTLADEPHAGPAALAPRDAEHGESVAVVVEDHVARAQPGHGVGDGGRVDLVDRLRGFIAEPVGHLGAEVFELGPFPHESGFEARHPGIGLELGETAGQEGPGGVGFVALEQVDRHVVGRSERRTELEGPASGERRDLVELGEGRPRDDGVAPFVDAAAAGAAGELRELGRGEQLVVLAGELRQLVDHDAAGRQVDAEGQGLRGEDDPHEPLGEADLDGLLEGRHQAGVVAGDTPFETIEPTGGVEEGEISRVEAGEALLGDRPDPEGLVLVGETDPGTRRTVAAASSHPLRLKTNQMTGSRSLSSSSSRSSSRDGARHGGRFCLRRSLRPRRRSGSNRSPSGFGRPSTRVGSTWRRSPLRSPTA